MASESPAASTAATSRETGVRRMSAPPSRPHDATLIDAEHRGCAHWCGAPACAAACGSERCPRCFPPPEEYNQGGAWYELWNGYREARRRGPA